VSTNLMDRTADLAPGGGLSITSITSFGEDARGELYICDQAGEVFRVEADIPGGADGTPPSATLLTPNGGETLASGNVYTITWNASDAFGVTDVTLQLSVNGGSSYSTIASGEPNDGWFNWAVPAMTPTNTALMKVVARDAALNSTEDVSNAVFTIGPPPSAPPAMTVLAPNGGEILDAQSSSTITWNATDDVAVTRVDLHYSTDGGGSFAPVAIGIPNSGSYLWSIPETPTTLALVRATAHDANFQSASDQSDAVFEITMAESGLPGSNAPPKETFLGASVPEPFRLTTRVRYGIPSAQAIELGVFSVEGRMIRSLARGQTPAGTYEKTWDGRDDAGERVTSGLYFLRLTTPDRTLTKRVTLLR
jgi:hypothetical protein